jgi:predicted  nucleic acid-binding Zn-ribbon protein
MTIPNFKEEMKLLVELQELDKEIFGAMKEKDAIPTLIETLAQEFEAKRHDLKKTEEHRQKLQLTQKQKEGDLAAKEEGIKKAQAQLGALKTNKDYQIKLAEIEGLKADKSLIEEEVLRLMDEIEISKAPMEAAKQALIGEEKIFNEKKSALNAQAQEIAGQIEAIQGRRKIMGAQANKRLLEQYEHILHGRGGIGIVAVTNNSCQGCHMHVPHQVINEIQMHEHLITCEVCSRILYLPEDVGI